MWFHVFVFPGNLSRAVITVAYRLISNQSTEQSSQDHKKIRTIIDRDNFVHP